MKLGVTGGIGSGKTSVCRVFGILGVPVFSTDYEASVIMENDIDIIKGIKEIAGKDLYTKGSLDRKALASIIFNNSSALKKVNSLVHPAVFKRFLKWSEEQISQYVIMEAAILFESGASDMMDKVAVVTAPREERIRRVMNRKRNKLTEEEVRERMNNQMDDETIIKLSDYIIYNSENDLIIPAVLKIHQDILSLIK